MLYGLGFRNLVADFLGANATTRRQRRLLECQRAYYFGMLWMDECLWLEPLMVNETTSDEDIYMTYYATVVWASALWGWFKLSLRCLLTLFILRVLWQRYCRHYISLLHALQDIGVEERFSRYDVIVGDPTYLILSDPRVSVAMVADIVTATAYVTWSTLRVWQGYLAMRFLSYVAKARRWELKFAPIDPGMLGLVALLYGGPVISLLGTTSLMAIFHTSWSLGLPSRLEFQAIDYASGEMKTSLFS
ncbi:unnamed protein product [Aphanomyces euteiches]